MNLAELTPKKLTQALERALIADLVPFVQGPPGVGKSDIMRSLARKYRLKVIDVRLSQFTPEDFNGLPMRDGNKAVFAPFDTFPLEGDPIPEGYDGWLIFMDELSSTGKMVQAAAYKFILDRLVGNQKLHERVMIVAAGNRQQDRAVVIQQSTALQSRLLHYDLIISVPDWIEWAIQNNIDSRIRAFIQYKPSNLFRFSPDHQDKTHPCPRTWYFVSKLIRDREHLDEIDRANIAAAITSGMAVEFCKFAEIAEKVPAMSDIFNDPETTEVPKESSFKYFVTMAVMDHTTFDNMEKAMTYMQRFPEEFQVIFLRGLVVRDEKFRVHPAYAKNALKILRFMNEEDDEYRPTASAR